MRIKVTPFGRQEISPPKAKPKIDPLFSAQFQSIGYAIYSLQEWNPQKILDLNLRGHQSYLITLPMLSFDQKKKFSMTR